MDWGYIRNHFKKHKICILKDYGSTFKEIVMNHLKLSPVALGFPFGILWGISLLLLSLSTLFLGYGEIFFTSMGALYLCYEAIIWGSLIGGIIGFVDAFITGLIIPWLYNFSVN